jgi:3-oxoacyl-[acyl-carrier protein] reductase
MAGKLDGKVALVTGGARGIGAAIVRRLVEDGATVVFTYASSAEKARALEDEIVASGGKALAIHADNTDLEAVRRAVQGAVDAFGRLDILVNNSGVLLAGKFKDFPLEDLDRMLDINVRAVFVASQAAARHMGEGGRIVSIGSVSADHARYPTFSAYVMTKGAIAALTRGLARELGYKGITVNVVQPGPTESDMSPNDTVGKAMRPHIALGRLGRDIEVASLVAYLASPEAGFITGATMNIDGGYIV